MHTRTHAHTHTHIKLSHTLGPLSFFTLSEEIPNRWKTILCANPLKKKEGIYFHKLNRLTTEMIEYQITYTACT